MLVRIYLTGNPLIRLLLQKQSNRGLHCLSRHFSRQLVFKFQILEHLAYIYFEIISVSHDVEQWCNGNEISTENSMAYGSHVSWRKLCFCVLYI